MKRRRKAAKHDFLIIDNDPQLEIQIVRLFENGLSPEEIVGYMRRAGHIRRLCHQTIYDWVHRKWQSRKEWLRFQGKPRVPYGKRRDAWQPDKRHISERPRIVEKRGRTGDWEGDLVHGCKDDSRHALLTLVDRASRFGIIWKITSLYPEYVAQVIILALRGLPVHTITFDNGFEFGHHKTIEKGLNCKVYFTDTNSPQQRGANENFNGLLRRPYFPKGSSLRHVNQNRCSEVAAALNGRPRKCLGYECPRTVFARMSGLGPYFTR
jgi:transposase, IS30 family